MPKVLVLDKWRDNGYARRVYVGHMDEKKKRVLRVTSALQGKRPPRLRRKHFSSLKQVGTISFLGLRGLERRLKKTVLNWRSDSHDARWTIFRALRELSMRRIIERLHRKHGTHIAMYIGGKL